MQVIEFSRYLRDVCDLAERTAASRVSDCRRIERYKGELDDLFKADGLVSMLQSLTYSTEDANRDLPARHNVPINGNLRNGTAPLKQAAGLYQKSRPGAGFRLKGPSSSSKLEQAGKLREEAVGGRMESRELLIGRGVSGSSGH